MMLPRTPYSGTVQGSLRVWPFSDLWNILQSADGTLRHCWLSRKARGRAESPRERRKSRSWVLISSTCERPLASKQAANATTSLIVCIMFCAGVFFFWLGLSTVRLFATWFIPVHSCSAVRNNELRPDGLSEIRWVWGRRETEPGPVLRNQLSDQPSSINAFYLHLLITYYPDFSHESASYLWIYSCLQTLVLFNLLKQWWVKCEYWFVWGCVIFQNPFNLRCLLENNIVWDIMWET